SYARIEVSAASHETLDDLLLRLRQHGGEVIERKSVQTARAPSDGVFPQDFYVTTNQQTFINLEGTEVAVECPMMDSAIAVDVEKRTARTVKCYDVGRGDQIVGVQQGIRLPPAQREMWHVIAF